MDKLKGKIYPILSIVFPLLLLIAWTISVEFKSVDGITKRVKIGGYDPIDLLSGHYLAFRYDFGPLKICEDEPNRMNSCVCVNDPGPGEIGLQAKRRVDCDQAEKSCALFIKGNCQYSIFLTSSERFYFPEQYSQILARVPENSEAEVSIQKDGSILLKDIYVNSQPILEYARDRLRVPEIKP